MNTTHSIRAKSSLNPIVTIAPKLFKQMKESHPDAVTLVLTKFNADYKRLTGKTPTLDYDQTRELMVLWGAEKDGHWDSKFSKLNKEYHSIKQHYMDGIMKSSLSSMDEVLVEAQLFFNMLEMVALKQEISPTID